MKTYKLTAERDRFAVVNAKTGAAVIVGSINRNGEMGFIEFFGIVAKGKNAARRAAIEAMGTKQDRARAYWENEKACASELGTVALVEDMAEWARKELEGVKQ